MAWPKTADGLWYIAEGQFLIPVTPETGVAQILLRPQGGMGVGFGAIAQGDTGPSPTFQEGPISFTELAPGDATPGGISVVQVSPGPPAVYALTGALHRGADGAPGTSTVTLTGIGGTAATGKLIKVNAAATGFDFAFEKVAERYVPATISSTAAGNSISLLATIPIPNKNFDYRVLVTGHTIVTQNGGSDVRVNLAAHLGTAGGNAIAQCDGIGGTERLTFSSAPPAGAADSFDKVTAGSGITNVYIRTEQQSGSNSYTTSNSTSRFAAWAIPVG